jgi:formylglycine-generating enzyme required for sulfatase activity
MNAPIDQSKMGLYGKFHVTRTDGKDAPGERHHGDEYFVLNLTTDTHAIPAIAAYADSCAEEYPILAADLRKIISEKVSASSEYVTVPAVTLPSGLVVPSFRVGKYLSSRGPSGIPLSTVDGQPWVNINYREARAACAAAGGALLTETQALAIAYDISQQDINWTGGKVGAGYIYQGLHLGNVSEAQPATFETNDAERRWHQLSNGERIYDFAGNAFTWVQDDVQGNEEGLTGKIAADSISLTTAPFPSMQKGMGWRPDGARDWSGFALVRGGLWSSGAVAGVFRLGSDGPVSRDDLVGFRCTQGL